MARKLKSETPPPIKLHKATGQAYVNLNGRRVYLGARYGTPEADKRHHRLITEWKAGGRQPILGKNDITIVELIARFMIHAESYYRSDTGSTSEVANFKLAFRPLKEVYGTLAAAEFSPMKLKTVRSGMVANGWTRTYTNKQVRRIRQLFKWAVAEELLDPAILQALTTVTALKRGRTEAPEPKKVMPVDDEHVEAIKAHVSRQVWSLVQLQRLTGARGGELFSMRAVDLDMSGDVWTYTPTHHKTEHHGHTRRIYLGQRAQAVVLPFLTDRAVDIPLFSPRESLRELNDKAECHRRPNQKPNAKQTTRVVGDAYNANSYRRAVAEACKLAGVPHWHPHQLRHTRATEVRRDFGLEVAGAVLGQKSLDATQVYAERNEAAAVEAARKTG